MGCGKWRLMLFFLFLMNFHGSVFVEAQSYCFDNGGNYTANSVYQTNLNTLLSSLPTNIGDSGFLNSSAGQASDRVNANALCRADIQLEACRSCIKNATVDILNSCPLKRQAIFWREYCTLRFSNESFFGILVDNPEVLLRNTQNVSSVQQFNNFDLRQLLDDLRSQAAAGGLLMKAAAGNRSGPDFLMIYSLVQCTPDISADDCDRCLIRAAGGIPTYSPMGVRVLLPSCILRYETVPFFNLSRIQEVEALLMPPSPPSAPPPSPPPTPPVGGISTTIIIIVVAAVAGVIIVAAFVIVMIRRKQRKKQKRPEKTTTNDDDDDVEISTVESLQYDFGKIRAATDDFSEANELGRGGFGSVYKGRLENGKEIAVKRLSKVSSQGDLEFKNEMLLMARLQHRNLLKIFGFAIRGEERLLIYELLPNLSLDHFIFDPIKRSLLNWDRRFKIIGGIARGLLYLHEDSRFRIIHRDLKASNILLDSGMNPKIADFGLARLFASDETEGNTSKIVGTYGYMSPEYAYRGQISDKTDVFSFGVLVLEIMSGQRNSSFMNGDRVEDMLSFAWRSWQEGAAETMIDPVLKTGSESLHDMLRCIHIGLLCVQENAADRLKMASVVLMLNSSSITMPLPLQPAFFVPGSTTDLSGRDTEVMESTDTEALIVNVDSDLSRNGASITELYPR